MKTFKPLPIPKHSAWDRKTWKTYSPVWLLKFFKGLRNLIDWLPVIWKDRHWDDYYVFEVLKHKIKLQRKYLVNANRHTRINIDNRDMTIVLNLIERMQQEFYAIEYLDYVDSKITFVPSGNKHNGEDTYVMEETIHTENFDKFLKKYKTSVRAVMKKNMETTLNKKNLCFYVAKYNQDKANKLLFKILEERLTWWWD